MAESSLTDPKVVAKLIKGASKGVAFAFALDKKVMAADKSASPAKVAQALKDETGSGKIILGEVVTSGKVIAFDVKKGSAGSAEKLLDEWTRKNGLNGYDAMVGRLDDVKAAGNDEADGDESDNRLYQPQFIRRCIKMAREKPVQFGFGIAAEGDMLGVHPRRKGKQIAALIKRETGAVKIAFGTIMLDGRTVKFTCEKTPIPGLRKRLVRLFKGWKLIVPIKVFGPEGEVNEDDDDEKDAKDTKAKRRPRPDKNSIDKSALPQWMRRNGVPKGLQSSFTKALGRVHDAKLPTIPLATLNAVYASVVTIKEEAMLSLLATQMSRIEAIKPTDEAKTLRTIYENSESAVELARRALPDSKPVAAAVQKLRDRLGPLARLIKQSAAA
ncbi:hypothetical protein [Caenispirillum bisanense]|uniref:hypothetical protein n=1 Tax=Caenispirillum bisanense TaxID=414052 RepID=UPI0031D0983E